MTSKILILGSTGQLGRALMAQFGERAIGLSRGVVDFADKNFIGTLEKQTKAHAFQAVINAAAYTQVDQAEGKGREEAFRVNAEAADELAAWCKQRALPLVHFSTDYVFDGSSASPRRENDPTGPLNAYGKSKLEGEKALAAAGGDYLIFRTSWVYDAQGKNFFTTMLKLFHEKDSLHVVDDQIGAPTYAPDLAEATLKILQAALGAQLFPSGTYHLCNGGETIWHGFASEILALAKTRDPGIKCLSIEPIPSSGYPTPARRPLNSRLDCTKAKQMFDIVMPHWKEGLARCIEDRYGHPTLQDRGPQDRSHPPSQG